MLYRIAVFVAGLLSLFTTFAVHAQDTTTTTTVVEKHVILSPSPKGTCSTIAAHWEDNIWRDTYTVCKYENRKEGLAWVGDYWSCVEATADGTCTSWELVPGHWVSTLEQ